MLIIILQPDNRLEEDLPAPKLASKAGEADTEAILYVYIYLTINVPMWSLSGGHPDQIRSVS